MGVADENIDRKWIKMTTENKVLLGMFQQFLANAKRVPERHGTCNFSIRLKVKGAGKFIKSFFLLF